jgi:SAM-dependent methyltransferase
VPVRAWFQPKFIDTRPEMYVGMNLITSLVEADVAERWTGKGVVTLKWAFGPQSEYSQGKSEYYRDQCEPFIDGKPFRFAGVGIDEWNPGSKSFAEESRLAAEGYRAARATWPDNLVVAWVTQPDETFLALLADGTFDLVFSVITLQHMAPEYSRRYIAEFMRICAPGGAVYFQITARPVRPPRRSWYPPTVAKIIW